ncbi:hypothetical protein PENFLA_c027G10696 [Penicillium flavigenum]|uniref:Uncharacterized protein n=1 Tax=Penicillium flavigenum TaxID=254877 RepID=A0A1V6SSE2_9EURO|nr:hypothetical protein PENFLA_c027G10696 [Penicillium flavigenum]
MDTAGQVPEVIVPAVSQPAQSAHIQTGEVPTQPVMSVPAVSQPAQTDLEHTKSVKTEQVPHFIAAARSPKEFTYPGSRDTMSSDHSTLATLMASPVKVLRLLDLSGYHLACGPGQDCTTGLDSIKFPPNIQTYQSTSTPMMADLDPTSEGDRNTMSRSSSPDYEALNVQSGLEVATTTPFTRLAAHRWLHGRTELDVFKLLIDTLYVRSWDDKILAAQNRLDII